MAEAQADTQAQAGVAEATLTTDEFQQLLQKEFRPQTDAAKSAIQQSVQTLAEQALANTALVSTEVVRSVEAIIAEIDRRLSEQMNKILHHPGFPAAGRRLARVTLPRQQHRDGRASEDQGLQHHQKGAAQKSEALQRNRLGSEPDLQEGLRA
jgi:hypothetical protein